MVSLLILLIVAAIAFPFFATVTSPKKRSEAGQFKHLNTALLTYASDHDDLFPGRDWVTQLRGADSLARCAAFQDNPDAGGHALSSGVAGARTFQVIRPEATVSFFDSVDVRIGAVAHPTSLRFLGPSYGSISHSITLDGKLHVTMPPRPN